MPSPFPGMDPYIEDPEIWSDFHGDLAGEIRATLNTRIQPRYVARLTPLVTYEEVEISQARAIRPDVGVWRPRPREDEDGVPEASSVVTKAPVESSVPIELPLRLFSIEIRDTGSLQLVTAIEILSPVNKWPGHEAFESFRRKRRGLLRSDAHLLEIDLLRRGERPPLERPVPSAPYYVVVSRADRRPIVEVWPIQLQDKLPVVPVPLLHPDPDFPLDLGEQVAAVYERGASRLQIDYSRLPPSPPFSKEESHWLDERLREQKAR